MISSYNSIIHTIWKYIPAKILVILNSIVIIPILAHTFSAEEMSYYFVAILLLNITCTSTSDWITKSILRFHEKFKIKELLDDFYSSITFFIFIMFILSAFILILFQAVIYKHLNIDNIIYYLTLLLLISCGIRQLLYQFLRVSENSLMYTISIALYQIFFLIIILCLSTYCKYSYIILIAMNIAIFISNTVILLKGNFNYKLKLKFNLNIIKESICYAMPLVLTNICYWFIVHYPKFYFQDKAMFMITSILGLFSIFVYNIIQPVATVFLFATFPIFVNKFEHNIQLSIFWTKILQLYFLILLPLVTVFCFYSHEITQVFFPEKYSVGYIVLPFVAISSFLHELLKLLNIKYHLLKKTHIESIISLLIAIGAYVTYGYTLASYGIAGTVITLCVIEFIYIISNILIVPNKVSNVAYFSIIKTVLKILAISFIVYFIIQGIFMCITSPKYIKICSVAKLILFITFNYLICYIYKKQILYSNSSNA